MKNPILVEIKESLDSMKDMEKVDLSILDNLSKLTRLIKEIKSKWLEFEDSDGFYFYQAVRSVELMLGKMEHRFKNSQELDYNPQIAVDSLALLPEIDRILEITQSDKVNDETINEVLNRTRDLMDLADDVNLNEYLETSRADIDKINMQLQFSALMKALNVTN